MSEAKSAMHSEDIELDEGDAEAVVGGAAKRMTMGQAVRAGYREVACGQHGTVMQNAKGNEIVLPYPPAQK